MGDDRLLLYFFSGVGDWHLFIASPEWGTGTSLSATLHRFTPSPERGTGTSLSATLHRFTPSPEWGTGT
ncbi:hypothetical protein [Bacillus weihaiensis]|uniref:hypothetical protein n=1 Tax=Bacillus weihaiensis TaxID=1547283 RepID=UPI0011AB6488|nr:hypothetical protein [Bacillus weihaiensis]